MKTFFLFGKFDSRQLAQAVATQFPNNYAFDVLTDVNGVAMSFDCCFDKIEVVGDWIITGRKFRIRVSNAHGTNDSDRELYKDTLAKIRMILESLMIQ